MAAGRAAATPGPEADAAPARPVRHCLHHLTAICGDPQRNLDFYMGVLGLRLVKRTVNFDDPETYHLYYGDGIGTPGTLLTFFPWPPRARGRGGVGQVHAASLAVPADALPFWMDRLATHGIAFEPPVRHTDVPEVETILAFHDPDGMPVELVASAGALTRADWTPPDGVDAAVAVRGLHAVTLRVRVAEPTAAMLHDVLRCTRIAHTATRTRYSTGDGGSGTFVDVHAVPGLPVGTVGVGTIHHVALRVPDTAAQDAMRTRLLAAGFEPSPAVDRQYFRSVYVREPGGVLLEIATDGPGFLVDEPRASLGAALMLPPQYEPFRDRIELALPPLHAVEGPPVPAGMLTPDEVPPIRR